MIKNGSAAPVPMELFTAESTTPLLKCIELCILYMLSPTQVIQLYMWFPNTSIIGRVIAHRGNPSLFLYEEPDESCKCWQHAAYRMLTDWQIQSLVEIARKLDRPIDADDEDCEIIPLPSHLQEEVDRREYIEFQELIEEWS